MCYYLAYCPVFKSVLTCIMNVEIWNNLIGIDYESLQDFEDPYLPT